MPGNKKKIHAFPIIQNRYAEIKNDSALSRLSSQLSTIAVEEKSMPRRILRQRVKTQPYEKKQVEEVKGEINKLKNMIAEKNLQRSLLIDQKLRRIARLSTKQVTKSVDSPRSAVNYISLSPQPTAPIYNQYPYSYPPVPSFPYLQPYNPYMNPSPPPVYHEPRQYERETYYRPRRKSRARQPEQRSRVDYEKNYDEYEQPTRYKKMRESNKSDQKKPNGMFMKKLKQKLMKKWRAVVWAIVFGLSLSQYCKKIMELRQSMFNKFEKRNFNIEMTMLTKYIVKKCKPFFLYIANNKQFELSIEPGQTERMQNEKAQLSKKLIGMLIEGIHSIKLEDTNEPASNPIELMHMFCKHGSFAVNQFMTQEELDMVSFSEKNRYLRLDRNLEISQFINFICSKILLYNAILNPKNVDAKLFPADSEIINKNFHFFGSIWYDLCIELQDEYLCQVPTEYQLGNWRKYQSKYDIKPARSLTANGSLKEDDQIISGMLDKKIIEETFGKNFWRKEKLNLKSALQNAHQVIVNYHRQLLNKIKF